MSDMPVSITPCCSAARCIDFLTFESFLKFRSDFSSVFAGGNYAKLMATIVDHQNNVAYFFCISERLVLQYGNSNVSRWFTVCSVASTII